MTQSECRLGLRRMEQATDRLRGTSREITKASQVSGLCWRPAFLEKGFPVLCGQVREVLARSDGQKTLALPLWPFWETRQLETVLGNWDGSG